MNVSGVPVYNRARNPVVMNSANSAVSRLQAESMLQNIADWALGWSATTAVDEQCAVAHDVAQTDAIVGLVSVGDTRSSVPEWALVSSGVAVICTSVPCSSSAAGRFVKYCKLLGDVKVCTYRVNARCVQLFECMHCMALSTFLLWTCVCAHQ